MPGEEDTPIHQASTPRWTRLVLIVACVLGLVAAAGAVVLFTRSDPVSSGFPAGADPTGGSTSTGIVSPSTTATPKPTTTRPPTSAVPAGPQRCPAYPKFPDASCTGVPVGMKLSNYSGSCTVKANKTIIDRKIINCALRIQAKDVVIKNSRINGSVGTPNGATAYSFTIMDSEVRAPQAGNTESQGIGDANFTALRVEVTGGNRGIYCRLNCHVEDSWVHGTNIAPTPDIHASAIRQSQGSVIRHNRIHCSAKDTPAKGGCSADLTGYGDFEPVKNNLIEKNLFVATPGGACAYGGSSGDDGGKPYGKQAENIRFIDNVFERGGGGKCGYYFPITDFNSNRPGNQWINNRWDDGKVVPPAN